MQLNLDLNSLCQLVNGKIVRESTPVNLENVAIDSRTAHIDVSSIFISLVGPRHNAHCYIPEVFKKDCRTFIVSENNTLGLDANFILVDDALLALQQLATYCRSKINTPVLAITGSYGKTIVKDWIHEIADTEKKVYKSPKSYNSQVGVSLALLSASEEVDLSIIEAGISTRDEMSRLASIITPNFGLITNIGSAHNAGFTDIQQKIEEKLVLFEHCETILFCQDHALITSQIESRYPNKKRFTWSTSNASADVVFKLSETRQHHKLEVRHGGNIFEIESPFHDHANLENICHTISACLFLNIPSEKIIAGVASLRPLSMRLVTEEGINHSVIIDDSYSNDFDSLKIALDYQKRINQHLSPTLILSDLSEHGRSEALVYREVADVVKAHKINKLISVGEELQRHLQQFDFCENLSFSDTESLLKNINKLDISNELILIKGGRNFSFEKVVKQLQQRQNETVLEVNLKHLENNLNYLKSLLPPQTKIMAMVKAFSYGAGSYEIAQFLSDRKVDYLAVAYLDEGLMLRERHITNPIMVMNVKGHFNKLLENELEPEIFSLEQLDQLIQEVGNKKINIHLKLDVGMHRLGFNPAEVGVLAIKLAGLKNIRVVSAFSHLPSADEVDQDDITNSQIELFETLAQQLEDTLGYSFLKHILNSAGSQRFSSQSQDMVRLGIGLYGIGADQNHQKKLTPISELRTIVSSVREVKKDEPIGYGGKGRVKKDGKIATIAIGYADGYNRLFSNGVGEVAIKGKRYPVVGNVCMDMCMIDIGNDNIHEGDAVVIFGAEIPVYELAEKIGTIPYEILTSISERVKRTFIYE